MGGVDQRRHRPRLPLIRAVLLSAMLCSLFVIVFLFQVCVFILVALSPVVVVGQDQTINLGRLSPSSFSPPVSPFPSVLVGARTSLRANLRSDFKLLRAIHHRLPLTVMITVMFTLRQWLLCNRTPLYISLSQLSRAKLMIPLLMTGVLQASHDYTFPDESPIALSEWNHPVLLDYNRAVTGFFNLKLLSKMSRSSSIAITEALNAPSYAMVMSNHDDSGPPATLYPHSFDDFGKTSFASKCPRPRALISKSHAALHDSAMFVFLLRSLASYFLRRLRINHQIRPMTLPKISFRTGGVGELSQNPNAHSIFQMGFHGPYIFSWTWVLHLYLAGMVDNNILSQIYLVYVFQRVLDLGGLVDFVSSQSYLVYVIHPVIVAHDYYGINLTSLLTDHLSIRESPTSLSLILRVVNPEWFSPVRRYISSFKSSRTFQAAERRANATDSLCLPHILDSLKCLEHLSHRELCCVYYDSHIFSSLLEALSCISFHYVSFASVSYYFTSSLYPNYYVID